MLSQLVYVSKRDASCTDSEIQKILSECQRNNKEKDITGVLLYSPTHFVQYLEGKYNEITELYDKIKLDSRHNSAVMLGNNLIKERAFPSWQMGAKKFNDGTIEYESEMKQDELRTFQDILAGKNTNNSAMISVIKKFFK